MIVKFEFENESVAANYYQKDDSLLMELFGVNKLWFDSNVIKIVDVNGSNFQFNIEDIELKTLQVYVESSFKGL